jgi:hypothetical protein
VAGHHDLVLEIAEKHLTSDPLAIDAWVRKLSVELHTGDFASARETLAAARRALGPHLALVPFTLQLGLLQGNREGLIESLRGFGGPPIFVAAVTGDRETAMRLADERERQLELEAFQVPVWLLASYYEIGADDRLARWMKRIDEQPVSSAACAALRHRQAVNARTRLFILGSNATS